MSIDLDAIQARWSGDGGMGNGRSADDYTDAGCRIFAEYAFDEVPALVARVRELEAKNTNLGIARSRAADALDRVALYGKNLTETFRPETPECEIGGEILLRIATNPLPGEGGPR